MARRIFFSFHYKNDAWRAAQVRNMGVIEGNSPVSDNDWETVKRGGDKAIQQWIDNQLGNRSCTIVLVGEKTAERKWITYEIKKSWELGKGVVGIYIHKLKDKDENQSNKGENPFEKLRLGDKTLANIVKLYNPPHSTSIHVYSYIKGYISNWVEEAIEIRNEYKI